MYEKVIDGFESFIYSDKNKNIIPQKWYDQGFCSIVFGLPQIFPLEMPLMHEHVNIEKKRKPKIVKISFDDSYGIWGSGKSKVTDIFGRKNFITLRRIYLGKQIYQENQHWVCVNFPQQIALVERANRQLFFSWQLLWTLWRS